jgi:hypothetical protein
MRLLYYRASSAIVWLGTGDENSEMVFDFVSRLARSSIELKASDLAYDRIPNADHLVQQFGLGDMTSKKRIGDLTNLPGQPWFERVWIVQEVAVSSWPKVVQGNAEVLWQDFAAAVKLVWQLRLQRPGSTCGEKSLKNVLFIEGFRQHFYNGKTTQLKRLAKLFRDTKSTDPRDKLYALVGISNDASSASSSMLSYERSVSDSFRLWTIHTIQSEKSLEVLSTVNRSKSHRNTMAYSRVPDWDSANDENAYHVAAWASEHFKASGSSEIDMYFRNEQTVLGVTRHLLERVQEVGLVLLEAGKPRIFGSTLLGTLHNMQQVWKSWEEIAQFRAGKRYRHTGESIFDAYWQTVLFGAYDFQHEKKDRVREEFIDSFAILRKPWLLAERLQLHRFKHLWAIYSVAVMILRGFGVFGKDKRSVGILAFSNRSSEVDRRRMIRTGTGYIGLTVHAAQVGDYVCLLKGARMPFLVRPASSGFHLVCDCYIRGIMYGERWRPENCETL